MSAPPINAPVDEDHQIILEAEAALQNPIVDPAAATNELLEGLQKHLSLRAHALIPRYWTIHQGLTAISSAEVKADREKSDPVEQRRRQTQEQANLELQKMANLVVKLDSLPPRSRSRKTHLAAADRQLRRLQRVQAEMQETLSLMQESVTELGQRVRELDTLWKDIQGAENLAIALEWRIAMAKLASQSIFFAFLLLAFGLAIAVDRYTPIAESLLSAAKPSERHDIAISLLFFAQAIVFEPAVTRAKRLLAWRLYRRLVSSAKDLARKIHNFEQRCAVAEQTIANAVRRDA